MHEAGRLNIVLKEMEQYNLNILGLSEVKWNRNWKVSLSNCYTLIYSGREEGNVHREGVALILTKEAKKSIINRNPVSPRNITARYNSRVRKITVIQCYAPTEAASDEDKNSFEDSLSGVLEKAGCGNINRSFECESGGQRQQQRADHGAKGVSNNNGDRLIDLCDFYKMVIGGTLFQHKECPKASWVSPDGRTTNQIDHIAISRTWRKSSLNVRCKR